MANSIPAQGASFQEAPTEPLPSLKAYNELIAGPLQKYLGLSKEVGGTAQEQAQNVEAAFNFMSESGIGQRLHGALTTYLGTLELSAGNSKPWPMLPEAKDSAQFWVNRVSKDCKET
ncbi:hypothetical protein MJO28_009768 [Puccinia striiformis f. sp. tritici]|uniref:Uncharacterized protein n=1 Tax=Puccinia striiformis f. sp. tritici TaxID=168172 RepID=A0ACC0E9M7_9BASI|nr:hypothetical protein MJO28_009768 [Puccinia striiformis f. sp. tritici]